MNSTPLISCIMPTHNRRPFVRQAIRYFRRQDYPQKELVIVDDGEDAVDDLVPKDERIRYIHLENRLPLGAKRNLACQMSHGDLIAHWDDDDWNAPNRLSVQISELTTNDADVCGMRDPLHYHLERGEAWQYCYPPERRPWLAGYTLLYRRSAWARHPFPDGTVGETTDFIRQFQPGRLRAVADPSLCIALIHPNNTVARNLAPPRWRRRSLDDLDRLLSMDLDFYVALRNGGTGSDAFGSRRVSSTVTVAAPFMVYDGYGSMAEYVVLGMARAGASVNVVPLNFDLTGMSPDFKEIFRQSHADPEAPVLYFCWLNAELERFRETGDLFINTMWESNRLPSDWPSKLNQVRAVIVPTRFVARVCRESGVKVPIEVVPQGIDPDLYHYERRSERPGLTTLIVGTVIHRKHTGEGIAAWKLAFGDDPGARLIIKARFGYGNYAPDDPRIRFVDTNETTRGIAHYYRQADVLLALGNEGFGLPLVEGMATGLPVIALNSEGQSDLCEEARQYLLPVKPYRWEPCEEAPFGPAGMRGVPGVEEVAARLRWVANHRDEADEMGRAASEWVLQHRNIWAMGPRILEVMEGFLQSQRPLRRAHTLWVPSWGSPCGIAEYTAHLAEAMPTVRATGSPPDMRGVHLLHVQHHDGIFEDAELRHYLRLARHCNIPTLVTEHEVGPAKRVWEQKTDVLVALTKRGIDMLQTRWPGKQVEHIPHGCPTWFPPRKPPRGERVIGTFGFLERHKGFWDLLDALRKIPRAELLMYSHAKSAEIEAHWRRDARGLPVRRVSRFLPAAEVARQLAARADVLVFWYDEIPSAATSGAVRVGLATGVPVLTSPTSWFDDVREVTYQPQNLVEGAQHLLEDRALQERITAGARDYCHENSWHRVARRHQDLWQRIQH